MSEVASESERIPLRLASARGRSSISAVRAVLSGLLDLLVRPVPDPVSSSNHRVEGLSCWGLPVKFIRGVASLLTSDRK